MTAGNGPVPLGRLTPAEKLADRPLCDTLTVMLVLETVPVTRACRHRSDSSGDELDGAVGEVEDQVGEDPEDQDEDQQRRPSQVLGHVHVVDVGLGELLLGRAEGDPLEHPQQVAGGEDGADGGHRHVGAERRLVEAVGRLVGGQDGGELAPEPGQAGQAQ